jgi:hypothetical protein
MAANRRFDDKKFRAYAMSDSNSSSAQSTSYTDNRIVQGQGAIYANNGANVYALDGGAIQSGFSLAEQAGAGAFDFGRFALSANSAATQDALNFASDAYGRSIAASQASAQYAANSASDSLAFAQDANSKSIGLQRDALGIASDSMNQALAYGGKQTAVALDSLMGSAELVKNAYADAKGRGAMTDYLLLAAMGVAGLVAYSALKN